MVEATRYAEKFESIDALTSYVFPGDMLEYAAAQGFRKADQAVIGADYAHDFMGALGWTKEVGEERVRFWIVGATAAACDTEFDACLQKLRETGLGKLFVVDSASVRRWCYAKLVGRPAYSVDVDQFQILPCEATFARYSDWFASAPTTGSQALSATPTAFTITNAGNARVRAVTFRLRSNAAAGFADPALANADTGQSLASTRDAVSVNSELRIVTERMQVQWSDDDGVNYSNDYDKVTLGNTQVALMELAPGVNDMTYTNTGAPNATLEWSFYPAYH